MEATDGHSWAPVSVEAAAKLMERFPGRWWISGGHALELHLGRSWRSHYDIDVGVLRSDAPLLRDALRGMEIHLAAGGRLTPWDGGVPSAERAENNLWARRGSGGPWLVDFPMNAGDLDAFVYRRDTSLHVPWPRAILSTSSGIPYLAPALQLLFKSKHLRAKDAVDACETFPFLSADDRELLRTWLPSDHPWRYLLEAPVE